MQKQKKLEKYQQTCYINIPQQIYYELENKMEYNKELTLVTACKMQNYNIARKLIKDGADVNVMTNGGVTPIEQVIRSADCDTKKEYLIEDLIEHGGLFDLNVKLNSEDESLNVHISMIPLLNWVSTPLLNGFLNKIKKENPLAFNKIFSFDYADNHMSKFNFEKASHVDYMKGLIDNGANVHELFYVNERYAESVFSNKKLLTSSLDAIKVFGEEEQQVQETKLKNFLTFIFNVKNINSITGLDRAKLELAIDNIDEYYKNGENNIINSEISEMVAVNTLLLNYIFDYEAIRDMINSDIEEEYVWKFYNIITEHAFVASEDFIINMCDNITNIIDGNTKAHISTEQLKKTIETLSNVYEMHQYGVDQEDGDTDEMATVSFDTCSAFFLRHSRVS